MPLFGEAYAAPNKGTTIKYWFRSPKTQLNPPANSKIQVLFEVFECFSSTFQVKFNFQGLFKTVLFIQVLFKPVQTLFIHALCMQVEKPLPEPVMLDYTNNTKISHSRSIKKHQSTLSMPGNFVHFFHLQILKIHLFQKFLFLFQKILRVSNTFDCDKAK